MPWFYDSRTGAYAEEAGALGFLSTLGSSLGLGWHQYATQQDMLNAIAKNHWPAPTTNPSNPVTKTAVGTAEAATGSVLGLPTLENLRPFMVRVVKVVLGGVLIIAGLTMLVKQETNISVGDVAKVAAL